MFVTITNGMSNTINSVPMENLTRTRTSGGLLMQPMDMRNLLQTILLKPRSVRAEGGSIATIYWGAESLDKPTLRALFSLPCVKFAYPWSLKALSKEGDMLLLKKVILGGPLLGPLYGPEIGGEDLVTDGLWPFSFRDCVAQKAAPLLGPNRHSNCCPRIRP